MQSSGEIWVLQTDLGEQYNDFRSSWQGGLGTREGHAPSCKRLQIIE